MAANKVTAVRLGLGRQNRQSGTIKLLLPFGGFFLPQSLPQEAFALARSRAARRRSRLSRRRLARSAGCGSGGTGADEVALVSTTGGASALSKAVGRASINSSNARPLDVIFHPPLIRSTNPCEKMSRSGTLAARRLVRSAQSRPLVARMAISLLRSSITAKPSG